MYSFTINNMETSMDFVFNAAHRLTSRGGRYKELHGHTYKLEVTIEGPLDKSGTVMDHEFLAKTVRTKVTLKLGHRNLNKVIKNPTLENVAIWSWDQLKGYLPIKRIKLWANPALHVTYQGD